MVKLVVITGATGKQGGSVVNAFLRDPSFKVRATVRDPSSTAAKELSAKGVEVLRGDINDEETLMEAFKVFEWKSLFAAFSNKVLKGANYIYAMTGDMYLLHALSSNT